MKKISFILLFVAMSVSSYAVDILSGTFYFDNSKTQYGSVKFLYGSDYQDYTVVVDLIDLGNGKWELTIPSTVPDMYRYSFSNTSYAAGVYQSTFSNMKDEISNVRMELRTATTDQDMVVGATYTPASGSNWTQGSWISPYSGGCYNLSNTLPVFYLNTLSGDEITSKEVYVPATMYIDAMGQTDYQSYGTQQNPINTEVKGRGNYTWIGFDKKPYRIKMETSASLLNLSQSKSFCLLAHADDDCAFMRNTVGFELSRIFGLPYTPGQEPVELVMNGQYWGLYFLTDHITVSSTRVNIVEQADNSIDPLEITGGWLLEIDNYDDVNQIVIQENEDEIIRFSYKSPEVLSYEQESYMTTFLENANAAIYNPDKNSTDWENYIDLESAVNFYIVQEIMGNAEGFHGSCYLYKDRGNNTKLNFGPVWDFGNSYRHSGFIYDEPPFGDSWISELVKFPHFQSMVQQRWNDEYWRLSTIYDLMDQLAARISSAANCDCGKWPSYSSSNFQNGLIQARSYLNNRISWLQTLWQASDVENVDGEVNVSVYPNPSMGNIYISSDADVVSAELCDLSGRLLQTFDCRDYPLVINVSAGTYLMRVYTNNNMSVHKILVH